MQATEATEAAPQPLLFSAAQELGKSIPNDCGVDTLKGIYPRLPDRLISLIIHMASDKISSVTKLHMSTIYSWELPSEETIRKVSNKDLGFIAIKGKNKHLLGEFKKRSRISLDQVKMAIEVLPHDMFVEYIWPIIPAWYKSRWNFLDEAYKRNDPRLLYLMLDEGFEMSKYLFGKIKRRRFYIERWKNRLIRSAHVLEDIAYLYSLNDPKADYIILLLFDSERDKSIYRRVIDRDIWQGDLVEYYVDWINDIPLSWILSRVLKYRPDIGKVDEKTFLRILEEGMIKTFRLILPMNEEKIELIDTDRFCQMMKKGKVDLMKLLLPYKVLSESDKIKIIKHFEGSYETLEVFLETAGPRK